MDASASSALTVHDSAHFHASSGLSNMCFLYLEVPWLPISFTMTHGPEGYRH